MWFCIGGEGVILPHSLNAFSILWENIYRFILCSSYRLITNQQFWYSISINVIISIPDLPAMWNQKIINIQKLSWNSICSAGYISIRRIPVFLKYFIIQFLFVFHRLIRNIHNHRRLIVCGNENCIITAIFFYFHHKRIRSVPIWITYSQMIDSIWKIQFIRACFLYLYFFVVLMT